MVRKEKGWDSAAIYEYTQYSLSSPDCHHGSPLIVVKSALLVVIPKNLLQISFFAWASHILETAGSAEKFQWQISPNFPLLYHSPNLRYYFCENFPIISPKSSTSVPDGRRVIGKQASIGKIKTRPADIIISIINQDTGLGICIKDLHQEYYRII